MTLDSRATVLSSEDIAGIDQERMGRAPGALNRVLWSDETSMAGLLTVESGHCMKTHSHHAHHHHVWMLSGHAEILGERLGPGSYVHIPRGVSHGIDASGSEGCTLFYLYLAQAN